MIAKYEGMTAEQVARTVTDPMRYALATGKESEGSAGVLGHTNTIVALMDRGLVHTDGRWTALGREVARLIIAARSRVKTIDELHELAAEIDETERPMRLARAENELRTNREIEADKQRLGLAVDSDLADAAALTPWLAGKLRAEIESSAAPRRAVRACCSSTVGSEHEGTCASIGARCERAVETMRNPRPSRTVRQLGVWTAGDRVHVVAAFSLPGDVWTIRELVVHDDAPPCAAIELTHRSEGGMPLGTTSSAVGIEWLRPLPARIPPRGVIELTESLMSAARTAASSSGQFVEYGAMRAALRAAFRTVGYTVEISPGLDAPDAPTAPAVGGVA